MVVDERIEVIPGVEGVRAFETGPMTEASTGHEVFARVRYDDASRQYECEEIRILRGSSQGITSETLRSVPIETMVWGVIQLSLLAGESQWPHRLRDLPNPADREPWGRTMPAGIEKEGPTDRVLKWVAHFYRFSVALHEPPTAGIQQRMGVSRATAGRWVAAARRRGFLGASIHGKAGESPAPAE